MKRTYLATFIALSTIFLTSTVHGEIVALITPWGYLKTNGVKDDHYQCRSLEDQASFYKHTELKIPPASLVDAMIAYHAKALGIRMPNIYLDDEDAINAASSSTVLDGVVSLNLKLLQKLTRREISGVIAHECGHIQCKHTLKKQTVRLEKPYADYLAYSRICEYEADLAGCHNLKTTQESIDALTKLYSIEDCQIYEEDEFLSTHPPILKRIERLKEHLEGLLAQQPALAGA